MIDGSLRDEINKRLTLNWLIQGAAQHAGMTFHHVIRDELDAIDSRLLLLYDQYALINLLQYWHLDAILLLGSPKRFWRRAASKPSHPFFHHPLLSRYGGVLASAARQRAIERCKEKRFTRLPIVFTFQTIYVISRLTTLEAPHLPRLVQLAKESVSTIWGIPLNRLDAELAGKIAVGDLMPARTVRGSIWRSVIVGYGGVFRRDDSLVVVGKGTNLQLLTKELVKGTAELICLHGLNHLSDETYAAVLNAADWLEFEPWMLQTGGELFRRLLPLLPAGQTPAVTLMYLARLSPKPLEELMLAVLEKPEWAKELLGALGTQSDADQ